MMDMIAQSAFQTPSFPAAEAKSIGSSVRLISSLGGFTPNTNWRMHCPPDEPGRVHYETKKAAIDPSPQNLSQWQFGFPVRFAQVDIPVGQPAFVFWGLRRNGLPDVELQLANHQDGHQLKLLNAAGVAVAVKINAFSESEDHWVEGRMFGQFVTIFIDDVAVFAVGSNFRGDTSGDYDAYLRFEGQLDPNPEAGNTDFYFGPSYLGENSSGLSEFLGRLGHDVGIYRHVDTTADKGCDEFGNFPGNAEDLTVNTWDRAGDDDKLTSAQYTGDGSTTIGSAKEMGGPAPHVHPRHVPTGCKYVFVAEVDLGGNYKVGHGARADANGVFLLTTISVPSSPRTQYAEFWTLPGFNNAPAIPHERQLSVMGHFVESESGLAKKLKLIEAYFFVFGPQAMMTTGWPPKIVQREHATKLLGRGLCRGLNR